jgi:hypothetical protein
MLLIALTADLVVVGLVVAASGYTISWFAISNGGYQSTGGTYSVKAPLGSQSLEYIANIRPKHLVWAFISGFRRPHAR